MEQIMSIESNAFWRSGTYNGIIAKTILIILKEDM